MYVSSGALTTKECKIAFVAYTAVGGGGKTPAKDALNNRSNVVGESSMVDVFIYNPFSFQ